MTWSRENIHTQTKCFMNSGKTKAVLTCLYATNAKHSKPQTKTALAACPDFTFLSWFATKPDTQHKETAHYWNTPSNGWRDGVLYSEETMHQHGKSFLVGPPTWEFTKKSHTHSFKWKIDPFKYFIKFSSNNTDVLDKPQHSEKAQNGPIFAIILNTRWVT